jgi:hypothetical protein
LTSAQFTTQFLQPGDEEALAKQVDELLEEEQEATTIEETPSEAPSESNEQEDSSTNEVVSRNKCSTAEWEEHRNKAVKFLKDTIIEGSEEENLISKAWLYELYKGTTFECVTRDVFTHLVYERYNHLPSNADRDHRIIPRMEKQVHKIFPLLDKYLLSLCRHLHCHYSCYITTLL